MIDKPSGVFFMLINVYNTKGELVKKGEYLFTQCDKVLLDDIEEIFQSPENNIIVIKRWTFPNDWQDKKIMNVQVGKSN